ncbi:fibronectin type III domain-containing protein [Candidatus Gottesmanbacteria bacterium]|nr:fibronectin type III domain-containing protein [Candidatus Gottesmanbacteria bacterium]
MGSVFFLALLVTPVAFAFDAPSLSGYASGGDAVTLSWMSAPDTTYQIWYGSGGNTMQYAAAVGQTSQYTVRSLFANTTYVFRVKALRGSESSVSNSVRIWVGSGGRVALANPVSSAPVVTQPVLWQSSSYRGMGNTWVSWSEVPDATGYQLWYGPKGYEYAHAVALPRDSRGYTVGALFQNTSYVFRVKALKPDGTSVVSNAVWVWVGEDGRVR